MMHAHHDRSPGRRGSSPPADLARDPEEMMRGIRSVTQLPSGEHRMHSTRNGGFRVHVQQSHDMGAWQDDGGEG